MTDDESRALADRITENIGAGRGMTLTADELAHVGAVAGKLQSVITRYEVMFQTMAEVFERASVKVVDVNGVPTLANTERSVN